MPDISHAFRLDGKHLVLLKDPQGTLFEQRYDQYGGSWSNEYR